MNYFQSTYHSKIYRDFKEIESTSYRQIIHFFEEKEEEIMRLEFDEYLELLVAYVDALFEVGAYYKHLLMVDLIIESSIVNNIQYWNEKDLFQRMLFRKAASLYNTYEYQKADYILRELIRIDPYDRDNSRFLKKCLRQKLPYFVRTARAGSVLLFLLTAVVIFVEVLLIRPFFRPFSGSVEMTRFALFSLGCLMLLGGDLMHRWRVEQEVNRFVDGIRNQKSGS